MTLAGASAPSLEVAGVGAGGDGRGAWRVAIPAVSVPILAGAALLGWMLGISWLHTLAPGAAAMVPGTAVAVLCGGLSLYLLVRAPDVRWRRTAGIALAGVMLAVGLLALAGYLLGLGPRVDRLLAGALVAGSDDPVRPAPQSAAVMVFAGTALILLRLRPDHSRTVELLVVAIMVPCVLAITGYVYEVPRLHHLAGTTPMAPTTALAGVMLGVGILLAGGGRAVTAITGPLAGAVAARRLLPLVLMGLPALALLRRAGQQLELYHHDEGVAALVLLQVILMGSGVLVMARLLNVADQKREEARDELERRVHERTGELAQSRLETLQRLALAAEYRDDDTYHHTERVARTAGLLAQRLGRDADEVARIRQASPLHDVGKLALPDSILLKPGALTSEEFERMKAHTVVGAQILKGSGFDVLQLAERIALYHHERWDGTGYPMGLRGQHIPFAARVVAVADVFDALTHERPYKEAWAHDAAVAEIERMAGSQFDPAIVACFLQLAGEHAFDSAAGAASSLPA